MVHAGVAFLEETCALLAAHPNLWATMESTFSLLVNDPHQFGAILGPMLQAAGPDRLMFASGVNLIHPRPPLDAFARFTMPDDLVEAGMPVVDDEVRRKILGANALRLHGLDEQELRSRQAGDEVEGRRADGLAPAWSRLRDAAPQGAA